MTTEEFSNEFDVLLNSYGDIGTSLAINEYEKSVLLTEVQEEIVKALYNGTLNTKSLEETEELRRSLDCLIETDNPLVITGKTGVGGTSSQFYRLKDEVWYIIYESVNLLGDAYCKDNTTIEVIPIRHDEWHRIKNNPFKRPNKRKAVRLDVGDKIVEIISKYPISNYLVRYMRRPNPIILVPLEDGLSINNETQITQCELNSALHRPILEGAVQLARTRIQQASK